MAANNKRIFGVRLLAVPLVLLLCTTASPTLADTTLSETFGKQLLAATKLAQCANTIPGPGECGCGQPLSLSSPSKGAATQSVINAVSTLNPSYIDNVSFALHHIAEEFQVGGGNAGCTSCGGGSPGQGLLELFLQRRHRYRDMTWQSSFGPGVYSNYDTNLRLYKVGSAHQADVLDPRESYPRRLVDGVGADSLDGVFVNPRTLALKEMRLYDGNGNLTTNIANAETAVIKNHQGLEHHFEIIDISDDVTDGLKAHWKLDEGSGTTAADSTSTGADGTLKNGPTWTTGKLSGALNFDGTNDYVSIPHQGALNFTGPITLSAWIKLQAGNGIRNIIAHGYQPFPQNEVYLRVNNGKYEVGCWHPNGGSRWTFATIPSGDYGQWVHIAGTFDGNAWRLYRNGVQIAATYADLGAVDVWADWAIGARGDGSERFFQGGIDDVRIYNRGLAAEEIRVIAQQSVRGGRLVKIQDRNGYATTITYKSWTASEIAASPERQYQIDKVTDASGRQATFTYKSTQVSGRWVVEKIDLPNGEDIDYEYTSGQLWRVTHADGTKSTLNYGTDSVSQTTTVEFDEASAAPTERKKKVYLTNCVVLPDRDAGVDELFNQSSLMVRMVVDAEGDVSYLNVDNPNHGAGAQAAIYEGSCRLKLVTGAWSAQYYQDGWTWNDASLGFDGIQGDLEPTYLDAYSSGMTVDQLRQARFPRIVDATGNESWFDYDSDAFPTKKTYYDSTTEEWAYNGFKQVTRYKDRLNRVTKYEYDSRGNRTKMQVGIRFVAGTGDVNQSEFAEYKWEYYPSGHANEFLLRYEYEAVATAGGSTNDRKEYLYNSDDLLEEIKESDDTGSGYHTAAKYTYENAGGTARRLKTSKDALGRITTYFYDERDRVVETRYHDESTERVAFGAAGSGDENLVVASQDRNGSVATMQYDDHGRLAKRITAHYQVDPFKAASSTTVTDLATLLVPAAEITDPSIRVEYTCTYLEGTNLRQSCTHRGETTAYVYDYRHRTVQTISRPRAGTTLTSTSTYINNLLFSSEDPYGRKSFNAYRSSDSALIRSVQATVPDPTGEPASFTDVLNLIRAGTPYSPASNAEYLITDHELDAEGQQFATIDPRGVVHASEFDSRGRTVKSVEAATVLASYNSTNFTPSINLSAIFSAMAARTETDYDARSNVEEVRHPRYFDASDSEGQNKCKTTMTYTRRNLLKTRTVAAGAAAYVAGDPAKVKVTESFTYYIDGRRKERTDFRGNVWESLWHACCGRFQGSADPADHGTLSNTDYYGNVTHTATVDDLDSLLTTNASGLRVVSGTNGAHDPPDADTVNETTTRYDARHRPVATTVWLVARGNVDPNDVPIAGGGATGDPALVISGTKQGLTTRWLYDENLTDGVGLDSAAGVSLPKLDGSGTFTVSIEALLDELEADLGGGFFGPGSDGHAVAVINPEAEISVTISDGAGRAVCSGVIASYKSATFAANEPITWGTIKHDETVWAVDVPTLGSVTLLETVSIDALDHENKSRSDGAGRTLQTEDAEGKVSTASYDGNSNVRSVRDPNGVGQDCDYDERNRSYSCTDTQGDSTYTSYNKHNRVIQTYDAKWKGVTCKFDPRDRRFECTDRVSSVTKWRYDENSNLRSLEDGENEKTAYEYDARNLREKTTWPDHDPADAPGDADYGITECTYDAAGRKVLLTDQRGDTRTNVWDMANRLVQRDYRTLANSPSGTISDSDAFDHDDAGRMIEADSGRYSNTVNFTHDDAGRVAQESLTVASQTYAVKSQYDAASRKTKITYPDGSLVIRDYTDRNQLEDVKYDADGAGTLPPLPVDHRRYDPGMRMLTRTLGNGKVETRTYRNDNLTQTISTPGVVSFVYDYDANKNKTKETIASLTAPAMAQYGFGTRTPAWYDDEDRLNVWNRDDGNKGQTWYLSKVGNWDAFTESGTTSFLETRTHGATHELTAITAGPNVGSLNYDPKGNMTENSNGQDYTWDFDNQLEEATVPTGSAIGIVGTHEYTYDALGRRVSKAVGGASPQTLVFVCSGRQVIAEYIWGAAAAGAQRKYVHASYIDERCLMIDRTALGVLGAGTEEFFYYHTNNLYSVAALTNAAGAPVERYAYDAYGNLLFLDAAGIPLATQTSTLANPHTYTGRRLDEETGLYYYRARYYDALLGRFISRDPILYEGSKWNLYCYVFNSPLVLADPLGLAAGAGIAFDLGFEYYKGLGGGLGLDITVGRESCCLPNGQPGWKDVYGGGIHGEFGFGVGGKLDILVKIIELKLKIATVSVDIDYRCETPCGAKAGACCKSCFELALNVPAIGPFTEAGGGIASFSINFKVAAKGSFRICYNSAGCPTPGLALGFCGTATASVRVTYGWFYGEAFDTGGGCFPLVGTAAML